MNKILKTAKDKIKGSDCMIKKIAWDTFKNTGDINAFLEFKQIESIENQIKQGQNEEKVEWDKLQEKIKGE